MQPLQLSQSAEFRERVPDFRGAYLCCAVRNRPSSAELWSVITAESARLMAQFTPESAKQQPAIAATRAAYKACGKDPSRYRPASEQLLRRVLQGKTLYRVNELVDLGNLVSLVTGFPTGLLDADKIRGEVVLGIGREDEDYEGIGRGVLNITGLPVYRDAEGAIATPTSDSTRTMLSLETQRLLFIINGYGATPSQLSQAVSLAQQLLTTYVAATQLSIHEF